MNGLIRRRLIIGTTGFTTPLGFGKRPNPATIPLGKIPAFGVPLLGTLNRRQDIQPGTGKDFDGFNNRHTEIRLLFNTLPN